MKDYLRATIYEHGNNITLTGYGAKGNSNATRGVISGFSKKSRQRIMRTMSTVDQSKIVGTPLFLTLTYPAIWNEDPASWKRDFDTFVKRLSRRYPELVIIWRMEFQKRGAPHFHCLLLNCSPARIYWQHKEMAPFINASWYNAVGSNDPDHFKAGINLQPVKSFKRLISYVSKYISKEESEQIQSQYPEHIGRFWGIINRQYMPITPIEVELTPEEFHRLRRIARNYLEGRIKRDVYIYNTYSGITLYMDYFNAEKLLYFIKQPIP